MLRSNILRIGLAGSILFPGQAVHAQQPVLLRLSPPVGQVSHYRTEMKTWMAMPGARAVAWDSGAPMSTMSFVITQTVSGAEGDTRETRVTVDSMSLMTPMGDMGARVMDQFRGAVIIMRSDSRGRVVSSSTEGGTLPPALQENIASGFNRIGHLPEPAVVAGFSWTDSAAPSGSASGPRVKSQSVFRVEKLDASHAVLSGVTTIASDSTTPMGGMVGRSTSEMELDLTAGRLVRSTSEVRGEMKSPQMGTMPMHMLATTVLLP